ncbi:MAG: ribose-phosphate pyrophosphokinase [Candidatus Diapherotrites archaeon]|nr:ribose-phosphate pyrophosphokinase [Candidatus Diapherotrites archaeon]
MSKLLLFSGTSNFKLAKKVARELNIKLGKLAISRFPDNETYCRFEEAVEGKRVFIIQSTCNPGNEKLMELLIIIDAAKRSKAKHITAVIPYYGYARQDRQVKPGEPISAALVAKLLKCAGADSIITMDLHSKAVEKAIRMRKVHLHALPVIIEYFKRKKHKDTCVVAPDKGALKSAKMQAKMLKANVAYIEKRRVSAHEVVAQQIVGNVQGKNCIIIDDIISTAGTICEAAKALKKAGAKNIYVAATHGVFAGRALQKLSRAPIKEVVVTDTIPQEENKKRLKKLKVLSVAKLFANAIKELVKH